MRRDETDNRMVKCVLDGYVDCPARCPEACICYQYQRAGIYEREYRRKYGEDK